MASSLSFLYYEFVVLFVLFSVVVAVMRACDVACVTNIMLLAFTLQNKREHCPVIAGSLKCAAFFGLICSNQLTRLFLFQIELNLNGVLSWTIHVTYICISCI